MYKAQPVHYPVTMLDLHAVKIMEHAYSMKAYMVESYNTVTTNYGITNTNSQSYYIQVPDHRSGLNTQFYSWNQSVKLAAAHAQYDVIVKMRPDVIYHPDCRLQEVLDTWSQQPTHFYSAIVTPDRVDDVIMCASQDVMQTASMVWHSKLAKVGVKYEIIEHLRDHGIACSSIPVRYAPLRPQSYHFNTLTEFHKIYMCDVRYYSGLDPVKTKELTIEDLRVI